MAFLVDIVFVIDESDSMGRWHDWIGSMVLDLNSEFENNIDGRYAIVGFGANTHNLSFAHKHAFGGDTYDDFINGTEWTSDANIFYSHVIDRDSLVASTGWSDAYEAIDCVLNRSDYVFREEALKYIVLVTDTCRESVELGTTDIYSYETISQLLSDNQIINMSIINARFFDVSYNNLLGVDYILESFIEDGEGGYSVGTWGEASDCSTINDSHCGGVNVCSAYLELSLERDGSGWNGGKIDIATEIPTEIELLRIQSFTSAFVDNFLNSIEENGQETDYYLQFETSNFYAPVIDIQPRNNISFILTRDMIGFDEYDPYVSDVIVHFKITIYSDNAKKYGLYSVFSLADTKRWIIKKDVYEPLSIDGVNIGEGESVEVIYFPDIYPQELTHQQSLTDIDSIGGKEVPLICGVNYYIDVEYYNISTQQLTFLTSFVYKQDCLGVEQNSWREDLDKNNWICSGQGKTDLLVANSGEQSLFPSIACNHFGYFNITWQSKKNSDDKIISAIWDSEKDILYASGQGFYEFYGPDLGRFPKVLTDQSGNFYISSIKNNILYSYNCSLLQSEASPESGSGTVFDSSCYPGYGLILSGSLDNILMRVYEEDKKGSLVINRGNVISVVENTNIRLDINGVYGAYAVRLRNSDGEWSSWIDIGRDMAGIKTAYFVDNSRFVVPWIISSKNGIQRICCQVLTFYGTTSVKCLDVFMNADILSYSIEFYKEESLSLESKIENYNGFPILSLDREGENIVSAIVYLKVIFNVEQNYEEGSLSFEVIHAGFLEDSSLPLVPIGTLPTYEYKGSFVIYKDDGIFYKDGIGFIKIIFNGSGLESCSSDKTDKYNLILSPSEMNYYVVSDPQALLEQYRAETVPKVLEINESKQSNNNDDVNFVFGDSSFFKD